MNMGFRRFLASLLAMTMAMIAISSSSIVEYSDAFSFSSSMSSFSSTSSTYIRSRATLVTTSIFENNNVAALFASSSSSSSSSSSAGDNSADADDNTDDHDENNEEEEKKNEQNSEQEDAAERWKIQAKELREQIQKMEDNLPSRTRSTSSLSSTDEISEVEATINELSYNLIKKNKEPASILDGKRILVVGANGRLGSMVCRKLLRTYPEIKELIAMVHVVGENSETSRGYGRLSYEVGAEDGRGTINPAWDLQDRNAYFEFDEEVMSDYNLQKLRVVECELLDPVQCTTIVENSKADIVVWCASDFNGNVPRSLSGGSGPLSGLPFLFRAVASPDKGRVEVEGLYNILGSLKTMRQEEIQRQRRLSAFDEKSEIEEANKIGNDSVIDKPVDFLLVSTCPDALGDFETPAGTFLDIKRQGEDMIPNDFPSLSYSVLQFAQYEDNFVGEDLELKLMEVQNEKPRITTEQPTTATNNIEQKEMNSDDNTSSSSSSQQQQQQQTTTKQKVRRINRRDAARAVTEAMIDPDFRGKKIQVWTNEVG